YRSPPRSGNEINGMGDDKPRRARHVFHSAGNIRLDWQALDDFFGLISPWSVIRHVIGNAWQLRNRDGPVNTDQRPVHDVHAMASEIKGLARDMGAELAGISRVTDDAVYEGRSVPFRYAICLGMSMDREEMAHVPHVRAAVEVMRVYRKVARTAIRLAARIRRMGNIEPVEGPAGNGPATYFRFPGAAGTVGVITPMSHNYCDRCNRMRLTADGQLRPCLFGSIQTNLRDPLRAGEDLVPLIEETLRIKPERHYLIQGSAEGSGGLVALSQTGG
ncbi:MAG: hypothetical protein IH921_06295, partial [Gemmatimonadetes bacterium]|nr:hypothetical protein [Gemmatimonadota bacterium]